MVLAGGDNSCKRKIIDLKIVEPGNPDFNNVTMK